MRAIDIIIRKRDGNALSQEEIKFLIEGCVNKNIPDYQLSAWLMAVFFQGMSTEETAFLTDSMLHSGEIMDLSDIPGKTVDKHSTGGVGDKISIPLAPIAAACGVFVPMMSGRGLGHTGGTLDKLDSITGYKTRLAQEDFKRIIKECGYAMTGQTEKVAPADKILYALRDVTGTVESIPLITASIMSKKAAEGTGALVFDVKCGNGAFMKTPEDAENLARMLVNTGKVLGKKCSALITAMDNPLGKMTGNFLEIEESMDILEGKGPADTTELTLEIAARMNMLAGKASSPEEGRIAAEKAVSSGRAMEIFLKNVALQGGDEKKLLSDLGKRRSQYKTEIRAESSGVISAINAYEVGKAGIVLGVGRTRADEEVCPDAGIIFHAKQGTKVQKGDIIMEAYGKNSSCLNEAADMLQKTIVYAAESGGNNTRNTTGNIILKEITDGK